MRVHSAGWHWHDLQPGAATADRCQVSAPQVHCFWCSNMSCSQAGHAAMFGMGWMAGFACRWQGEEQPLAFKPERWLAGAALKQGAWIPFGGGQRLCLGWLLAMTEMKVGLSVRGVLGVGVLCVGEGISLCGRASVPGELWSQPVVKLPAAAPQVLLAAIFRGHAMELRQPDEPWVSFPLARPKCSMPARFVAVKDAE